MTAQATTQLIAKMEREARARIGTKYFAETLQRDVFHTTGISKLEINGVNLVLWIGDVAGCSQVRRHFRREWSYNGKRISAAKARAMVQEHLAYVTGEW